MYTLKDVAERLKIDYIGDPTTQFSHASSLNSATKDSICFVQHQRYLKQLKDCPASVVIVTQELAPELDRPLLIAPNPEYVLAQVLQLMSAPEMPSIHSSAIIDDSVALNDTHYVGANVIIEKGVTLGNSVHIAAGCVIEQGAQIGDNSYLHPRVVVCKDSIIGEDCIFHPGVIIGSDGFGLAYYEQQWHKIPQVGRAIIKDRVEIGANTTVDRGALDDTIIHSGVKLDNQIQVAHNVEIGENTAIAACVGIAGSAKIGKNCQISGAAVVLGHLSVADNVIITAMSLVTKSIKSAGVYSSGTPLMDNKKWHKNNARYKQLDQIAQTVKQLDKNNE